MIVHGIPGPYTLAKGDILSVDIGVVYDGWVADAARTFPVGPISPVAHQAAAGDRGVASLAVEQCVAGNRLGDVSHAIQEHVEAAGLSIVRSLVGHGIGREMHEDPQIPNYGNPGTGIVLEEGMVLAVEPMVTAGRHAVRVGDDHWAIYSQDGSLAAHFEFTIAITADWAADPDPVARGQGRPRCGVAGSAASRARGEATRSPDRRLCTPPLLTSPVALVARFIVLRSALQRGSGGHNGLQSRAVGTTGNSRRERNESESTTLGQTDVREVQDHPAERPGARDLLESAPQAKARLRWHVSPVSTFPSTSASRSA